MVRIHKGPADASAEAIAPRPSSIYLSRHIAIERRWDEDLNSTIEDMPKREHILFSHGLVKVVGEVIEYSTDYQVPITDNAER